MRNKIIYVAAAGSGGHILPALTLAKRCIDKDHSTKIIFWTSGKALDQKIVSEASFISEKIFINLTGFSLKKFWAVPGMFLWLVFAFFKCFYRSIKDRPDRVICTGGLIGIPVCLACRLTGTFVELYELNAIPGKAVKFLLPIASKVYTVFPKTAKLCTLCGISFEKKCELIGYPLRFTEHDNIIQDKNKLIEQINTQYALQKPFSAKRKTIFVLGGSQGSHSLNNIFKKFLQKNQQIYGDVQVIHQTGTYSFDEWQNFYKTINMPAIMFSYNENLKQFYQLADLVICRAGAGTIFEVEFFAKPCILVPLITSTTAHQVQNAYAMAQKHPKLFVVLKQQDADLDECILKMLN